jgi:hypothetical protein
VEIDSRLLQQQPITSPELEALASAGTLYAVLDACDAPAVPEKARELGEAAARCLFQGEAEENFWAISPYLFHLDLETLGWLQSTLSADPWGIFVIAECGQEALWKHFRRFTYVQLPDEEQVYFRYYDPQVLSKFLNASHRSEVRDLFGPVEAFGCSLKAGLFWLREAVTENAPPASERVRPAGGGLFQVRQPHLDAFAEEAKWMLVYEIVEHLREHHPDSVEDIPEDVLNEMVWNGVTRGQQYGFASEASLTAFVATMFEFAPNFDMQRSIYLILTDPRVPVEDRMEVVLTRTTETVWRRVRQQYDGNAWFPAQAEEDF